MQSLPGLCYNKKDTPDSTFGRPKTSVYGEGYMKKTSEQWTTVIKPRYSLWEVNVREWWQYRDLIWLLVKRNFVVLYKQTICLLYTSRCV